MKSIWFVYPYGGTPEESSQDIRYIRFGKRLSGKYRCTWWTANFSHGSKQYRSNGLKKQIVQENLNIVLIPTSSYKRNISLKRVVFEFSFARNLRKAWRKEDKPDLIITPGTGMITAFRPVWPYASKKQVKTIFDIMDIHPIQSYIRKRHALLYPMIWLLTKINWKREKGFYGSVVGVTALGKGQLEVAKERTGNRNIPSCLIYNGIFVDKFRDQMKNQCPVFLPEKEDGWIWCIYAGSLGPSYDIPSIIECAKRCKENGNKILFIIAGWGELSEQCKKTDQSNLIYLGFVDKRHLPSIYSKCDIGLITFQNYSTVDMPDKFYDYTAAGLAIVSSLTGEVKDHIEKNHLGVQYTADNAEDLYRQVCKFETTAFLSQCQKNSWNTASEFDLGKQLDSLEDIIEKIVLPDE